MCDVLSYKIHTIVLLFNRFFLQRFVPGARTLTEKEAKSFMSGADDNSDGKIGVDGKIVCFITTRCSSIT